MSKRSAWQSVFDRVELRIRAGALDEARLTEELAELVRVQVGSTDDETFAELRAHACTTLASQRAAEAEWKEPTMNDRIDRAFIELDASGIVSLQNAGYTMSDGWSDVNQIATLRARKGKVPRGATFFHEQDAERGVAGKGLLLAFGAYESDLEKKATADHAVACEIVATLNRNGVAASWDGSLDSRILIAPFRWQKRRFSTAGVYPLLAP